MSSSARAMYLGGVQLPSSNSTYNGLDMDWQYRSTVRPNSGTSSGPHRLPEYPVSSTSGRLTDAYRSGSSLTSKPGAGTAGISPYLSSSLPHGSGQPAYLSSAGYTPSFNTAPREVFSYSVSAPAGRSTSVPRASGYPHAGQPATHLGAPLQRTPVQAYVPASGAYTSSMSRAAMGTSSGLASGQAGMATGVSILDGMRHTAGSTSAATRAQASASASASLASKPSVPKSTLTSGFTYSSTATAAGTASSQAGTRLLRPPQSTEAQHGSMSLRPSAEARLPHSGEVFRLPTHSSLPRPPVLAGRHSSTQGGSSSTAGVMSIAIPTTSAHLGYAAPTSNAPATSSYSIAAPEAAARPSSGHSTATHTALYSLTGALDPNGAHVQHSSNPASQPHQPPFEPLSREAQAHYLGNLSSAYHQPVASGEPSPSASSTLSAFLRPSHADADTSPRVSGTQSAGLRGYDTTSPAVSPARPSARHLGQASHTQHSTSPQQQQAAAAEPHADTRQQHAASSLTATGYHTELLLSRSHSGRQADASSSTVAAGVQTSAAVQSSIGPRLSTGSVGAGSAHLARCASNSSADSNHSSSMTAPAARSRRRMVDGSQSQPVSGQVPLQSCRTQPDEALQCSAVSEHVSSVVLQLRHQARKLRQLAAGSGCVGLQNLGNTCFMNSILQVLNAVPELVAWAHTEVSCKTRATFAPAYVNLVRSMWKAGKGAVSPSSFLNTLGRADSRWGDGSQQDAQEFLHSLLEGLRGDCNRVQGKPAYKELCGKGSESAQAVEAEEYARSWNDSVVDDMFGGLLQSTLQCQECQRQSFNYEPFLDLSLPLPAAPRGGAISIESCLQAFVEEERMQGSESVRCASCKRCCPHTKRLQIWRPPYTLVLTLKRFAQRGSGSSLFSRFRSTSKNSASVELEVDSLPLSDYCNPSGLRSQADACLQRPVYQLVGISHHAGSLEGGHYTASARNAADGQWYQFNDASVRREAEPSGASSSAYVLVYRLVRSSRERQEQ